MKHTIDMYTTRGQMCDAMQKEIDNLEAELADAKQANSYNADVLDDMYNDISELRKDRDRLDWIFNNSKPIIAEKNDFDCNMCTAELWFSSDGCSGTMLENRDELDNAMKEVIK